MAHRASQYHICTLQAPVSALLRSHARHNCGPRTNGRRSARRRNDAPRRTRRRDAIRRGARHRVMMGRLAFPDRTRRNLFHRLPCKKRGWMSCLGATIPNVRARAALGFDFFFFFFQNICGSFQRIDFCLLAQYGLMLPVWQALFDILPAGRTWLRHQSCVTGWPAAAAPGSPTRNLI